MVLNHIVKVIGTISRLKRASRGRIPARVLEAFDAYLAIGGVVKVQDEPFSIVYPNRQRLDYLVRENDNKIAYLDGQTTRWRSHLDEASATRQGFARFLDPVYIRHAINSAFSGEYREAVRIVNPPVHLMGDASYRRMMRMFVSSADYRERLKEARTSPLGKKSGSITDFAEKTLTFKKKTMGARVTRIKGERAIFEKRAQSLSVIRDYLARAG